MNICAKCGQPQSPQDTIVAVSGGFSWLHAGHVALIQEASTYGRVHVYLNSDEWMKRKYGKVIVPWGERYDVLMGVKGVELVIPAMDDDGTVCESIKTFKPSIFANGGDRGPENTPELKLCNDLKIRTLFGVGGKKIQSSSNLIKKVKHA